MTARARQLPALAALLAAGALVGGCGSSNGGGSTTKSGSSGGSEDAAATSTASPASSQPAALKVEGTRVSNHGSATAKHGRELKVEVDDNYFEPTVIKARPGSTVRLELDNEGQAEHNFTVEDQHINKDIEAGEDAVVRVRIPASGRVSFYCEYHVKKGMGGALEPAS